MALTFTGQPGPMVAELTPTPSGLYEVQWRAEAAAGRLDLVATDAAFVDCGSPADYLRANLTASNGASVVGAGARVHPSARVVRSVVWDGAEVVAGEVLVGAVRAGPLTVLIRGDETPIGLGT